MSKIARVAMLVSNPCIVDARVIKMARAVAAAGHEVHVFATYGNGLPFFEEAHGVIYHRINWRPTELMIGNASLLWLITLSRKLGLFFAKRLTPFLKYNLFSEVFADNVARLNPDLIHAHDLICLKAAHDAARQCSASVVYDAHELETHRNPPLPFFQKRWVSYLERKFGRRSAAVITVGRMVGEVLAKHLNRDDITVIYNSPMRGLCPRNIRSDLNLDAKTSLMIYVGKITSGRGVGEILMVLPEIHDVFFAAVGPCDEKSRRTIERQVNRLQIAARFRILPPVPFDQVVEYIKGADLGIISVEPITLSYQYCMPNKLFELSFANVPIMSNKLDEIEQFISELGNGEVVELTKDPGLSYKIYRMIQEKQKYVMQIDTVKLLEEKYSWDTQCRNLLSLYGNIIDK